MTTAMCYQVKTAAGTTSPRGVSLNVLDTAPAANPLSNGITGPRDISYVKMLRISVTDVCNLRCVYCMPEEGVEWLGKSEILSFEEIAAVVRASVRLGITHFKLTGGEPTARKDLPVLVALLRAIDGVRDLSLTTNGILLGPQLVKLKAAGLDRITVSMDSLRPERFSEITRGGDFHRVWAAIEQALAMGFERVKINVVVMRGMNENEVADFAGLTKRWPVTVRFIEFMPLGRSGLTDNPLESMVTESQMRSQIESAHGLLQPVDRTSERGVGPANVWRIDEGVGRVGFISAMSKPFCDTCNRLRMTPEGLMRSCLFDGGEVDLKPILRSETHQAASTQTPAEHNTGNLVGLDERVMRAMTECVALKLDTHSFTGNKAMNRIGG